MGILAERFDLRTGACLAVDIPPEHVPKVRITDRRTPPAESKSPSASTLPSAEGPGEMAHQGVAPVPARLTGEEIFTVGQLENYLERRRGASAPGPLVLQPEDVAVQFQTEDGSERTAWMRPHDRVMGGDGSDALVSERILRQVLERWDFQDAGAWRSLLRQALESEPRPPNSSKAPAAWERALARFAASATCRRLASATVCYRELEFLATLDRFRVRGAIDCLWQDDEGDWHLLAYATKRVPAAKRAADWRQRAPGLALAAQTVQRVHGAWPKSVTLFYFAHGVAARRPGSWLRRPGILNRAAEALRELLAQPLEQRSLP
jgi:hypothetical protein